MSSLLGEAHVPDDVRQRLLASAEGNPFYLEEMLHMLIEQGALEPQNGGWVSTDRLAGVSIPDSVHGVIAARIDLLETGSRDALRRCSVVGRSFWPAAVEVEEQVIARRLRVAPTARAPRPPPGRSANGSRTSPRTGAPRPSSSPPTTTGRHSTTARPTRASRSVPSSCFWPRASWRSAAGRSRQRGYSSIARPSSRQTTASGRPFSLRWRGST